MFLAWTAGPIVVGLGSLKILQRVRKRHPRRAPFTQRLERTPGGTLLGRIDELSEDITLQAVILVTLPVVAYAGYISHLYVSGREAGPVGLSLLALACLAVEGYFLFTIFKMIKLRRTLRLGYIGELTVGQRLNRMMLEGYRVYHDFPAEGFNIDHVVVGPRGVFAIETKTHSKPVTADRRADATVTYDGRMLHFPTGSSHEMIDQAKRQSKWLARWLSQSVGEPLTVRAVIALPGWLVKRTSPEGPPVVNPTQFTSLFEHIPPRPMSPETMARVVHQLDQRCNDIPAESLLDG
jgi:hypothetical protein